MKYEITVSGKTWSNHRTENGALKGYVSAVESGQNFIEIFRGGKKIYAFNTYDRDIGVKGYILTDNQQDCFYY